MQAGKIRFLRLCHEELSRVKVRDGIGLLAEKRLHGVLKRFITEDEACHEVRVAGKGERPRRFVADIRLPTGEIFEIQTGSLFPMQKKLAFYMAETDAPVTVIHPLLAEKYISELDAKTGETVRRRRSPLKELPLHGVAQLKPYLPYLTSGRFSLWLLSISAEEFRFFDPRARRGRGGTRRYEVIPTALLDTVKLTTPEDYAALFPTDAALDTPFVAKDFGKCTRLRGYDLYDALAVFEGLGIIEKCGKQGRAALYRKCN